MDHHGVVNASKTRGGLPSVSETSLSMFVATYPGAQCDAEDSTSAVGSSSYENRICFHVRPLDYQEESSPLSSADPDVNATDARCTLVCVLNHQTALREALGNQPRPRIASASSDATTLPSTTFSLWSLPRALRNYFRSSPSESGLQRIQQLRQQNEEDQILRYRLLRKEMLLRAIAKAGLGGWQVYQDTAVQVSKISGGLSNQLYLVSLDTAEEARDVSAGLPGEDIAPAVTKALIRVFGHQQGTALFSARVERILFKTLGSLGLAPRCLAEFEGGRIEEYWESPVLSTADLTDKRILERAMTTASCLLGESSSNSAEAAEDPSVEYCSCCCCRLELWGSMAREAVNEVLMEQTPLSDGAADFPLHAVAGSEDTATSEDYQQGIQEARMRSTAAKMKSLNLSFYLEEAKWLADKLKALAQDDAAYFQALEAQLRQEGVLKRPSEEDEQGDGLLWLSGMHAVLSHNDFQENNILHTHGEGLRLIDFEYSGVNARAFDIANLFCEATLDYTLNTGA
ncbi:choline ethanolamine [Cyclospora cayetanensis]|uniref:Choline ethanolamine n=1 Tax=Cyclospora cayetanensis TaxID=88456 RepID=A0A1D3D376_9EIME|nr:choline ethanolamine [Cyclospora cayetanensis]